MSQAELVAALELLLVDCSAVATAVAGDEYSILEFENVAHGLRTRIATLRQQADTVLGIDGLAVVAGLGTLGARLVDLRQAVSRDAATTVVAAERLTSTIELAVQLYADHTRAGEIAELNPNIPHPGFIRAGTEVVVRVR